MCQVSIVAPTEKEVRYLYSFGTGIGKILTEMYPNINTNEIRQKCFNYKRTNNFENVFKYRYEVHIVSYLQQKFYPELKVKRPAPEYTNKKLFF